LSFEPIKYFNCPQCGDRLALYFKYSKMTQCPSCKSTIFLEDEGSLKIGKESVLTNEPSLLKLHQQIKIDNKILFTLGKLRYQYGRGFWEEWFLNDDDGRVYYLSVDEGDFVLEYPKAIKLPMENILDAKVGRRYGQFVVQERGFGECIGFEGELPKDVKVGQRLFYLQLSFGYGNIVTAEYANSQISTYEGKWVDAFKIEVLNG